MLLSNYYFMYPFVKLHTYAHTVGWICVKKSLGLAPISIHCCCWYWFHNLFPCWLAFHVSILILPWPHSETINRSSEPNFLFLLIQCPHVNLSTSAPLVFQFTDHMFSNVGLKYIPQTERRKKVHMNIRNILF